MLTNKSENERTNERTSHVSALLRSLLFACSPLFSFPRPAGRSDLATAAAPKPALANRVLPRIRVGLLLVIVLIVWSVDGSQFDDEFSSFSGA